MNKCFHRTRLQPCRLVGLCHFPFHLAHLGGGIISLLYTTVRAYGGKYSQEDYHGVQLASIYGHFVDLLWIYLFIFLTLIR